MKIQNILKLLKLELNLNRNKLFYSSLASAVVMTNLPNLLSIWTVSFIGYLGLIYTYLSFKNTTPNHVNSYMLLPFSNKEKFIAKYTSCVFYYLGILFIGASFSWLVKALFAATLSLNIQSYNLFSLLFGANIANMLQVDSNMIISNILAFVLCSIPLVIFCCLHFVKNKLFKTIAFCMIFSSIVSIMIMKLYPLLFGAQFPTIVDGVVNLPSNYYVLCNIINISCGSLFMVLGYNKFVRR